MAAPAYWEFLDRRRNRILGGVAILLCSSGVILDWASEKEQEKRCLDRFSYGPWNLIVCAGAALHFAKFDQNRRMKNKRLPALRLTMRSKTSNFFLFNIERFRKYIRQRRARLETMEFQPSIDQEERQKQFSYIRIINKP